MNNKISKYVIKLRSLSIFVATNKNILARDFIKETGMKCPKTEMIRIINNEINRQYEMRQNRGKNKPLEIYPNRIINMQLNRRQEVERWNKRLEKAYTLAESLNYKFSGGVCREIRFGDDLLIVRCDDTCDWGYYSKSYGYPKITISNRRVELHKFSYDKTLVNTHYIDSFRGSFLINSIIKFYKLKPIKVNKDLQSIQLNSYFSIKKVKELFGISIYKRFLGKQFVDYCVVYNDMTYHDTTIKACLRNLKIKIKSKIEKDNKTINYEYGKTLGFCDSGMNNFADDNDLDIDDTILLKDLKEIVLSNKLVNSKYKKELSKLGINI